MEILRVEHLTKVYGEKENRVVALNDISFSVEWGQFVAIIGPSGSGKSTLLHILGGVDRPTSGKVFLSETDVYGQKDEQLAIFRRREVGLIYQFYNLIPVLNVTENMTLPVLLDGRKVNKERLEELLAVLKLKGREEHLPNELSGGQQQRVSIGRALMNAPAVMLADEPTGSVKLVQHYPKIIPVTFPALSTFISSMADRQRVRFSSRDKVSYIALKSAVKYFLTAAKSGGASCAGSGSCPSAAVYIS